MRFLQRRDVESSPEILPVAADRGTLLNAWKLLEMSAVRPATTYSLLVNVDRQIMVTPTVGTLFEQLFRPGSVLENFTDFPRPSEGVAGHWCYCCCNSFACAWRNWSRYNDGELSTALIQAAFIASALVWFHRYGDQCHPSPNPRSTTLTAIRRGSAQLLWCCRNGAGPTEKRFVRDLRVDRYCRLSCAERAASIPITAAAMGHWWSARSANGFQRGATREIARRR